MPPIRATKRPAAKSCVRIASISEQRLYTFEVTRRRIGVTTEYERLLAGMIDERKAKLAELTGKRGTEKQVVDISSDIRFLEVELQRYQQGMTLFRSSQLPKVGRWGRPETEEGKEEGEERKDKP